MISKTGLINLTGSIILAGLLAGCGGGGGSSSSIGAGGLPSHGPFVEGTTVKAIKLNTNGTEDNTFEATTTIGSNYKFSFANLGWSGPTKFIIEDGTYYNEATGGYSVGTLSAVENIVSGTTPNVNINILTDVAAKSIIAKMANGDDIDTAKSKARDIVVKTFNINLPTNVDLEDIDLTGQDDTAGSANSQLLQLSAAILSTNNPDEVIKNLGEDLSDDEVDEEGLSSLDEIQEEVSNIDLDEIALKMETKLNLTDVPKTDELVGTLSLDHSISFSDVNDVEISTVYEATDVVYGINGTNGATVTIVNGEFKVANGSYVTSGTVNNGETITVKQTSSSNFNEEKETILTIGGAQISFKTNTKSDPSSSNDSTPNAFSFGFKKDVTKSSSVTSEPVTISGINTSASVTIDTGTFEISTDNGQSWGASSTTGNVNNGDMVRVTHTSSADFFGDNTGRVTSTLTIGGVEGKFTSFTEVKDTTVDVFFFNDKVGQEITTSVLSEEITISGINSATSVSIDKGSIIINSTEYQFDDNTIPTIVNGDTIQLKHTSSDENDTEVTSKLTIGNLVVDFTSKTKVAPIQGNIDPTLTGNATDSTQEETAVTINYTASDSDGTVTVTALVDESKGTVSNVTDSSLLFTPKSGFTGYAIITVIAEDNNGAIVTKDITVTVSDSNDAPKITSDGAGDTATVNVAENTTYVTTVTAKDLEGDTLSYSITGGTDQNDFSINATSGELTFISAPNFELKNSYEVEVTVTDDGTSSNVSDPKTDVQTLIVNISDVNDAPTGSVTITGTATEDEVLTATDTLADEDGLGTVTYQWKADNVNISQATSSTYTLSQAEVGKAITVTVSYTDGNGRLESVTSSATSAVVNVNDATTGAVTIDGTATENQELTANVSALTDEDGIGTFTYQWNRAGSAISGATASTYTLVQADVGELITVDVVHTDALLTVEPTITSSATSAVLNVNDLPTGSVTITGTATEDEVLTASNTIVDEDGLGTVTYQWNRDGVAISGATASTYTLVQADVGAVITVTANYTDDLGTAESVTSSATSAVLNVNDDPILDSIGAQTIANISPTEITLSASDEDNDTLTYTATSASNTDVAVNVSGNILTLTPTANFTGNVDITVNVSDGNTGSDSETFTVTVVANTTPELTSIGDKFLLEDASLNNIPISAYDYEGDTLTYSATSSTNITASISGTTLTITPIANFNGSEDIIVSVTDGYTTDTETITVTVDPVNDLPTGSVTITGTATEDEVLTANTDAVSDVDGLGTFSYQWKADDVNISGAIASTYTLTQAEVGKAITVTVSYTDDDSTAESLTSSATSAVLNVNDTPIFNSTYNATVYRTQSVSGSVTATDEDNDTLTYSLDTNGSCGSATVNTDGTYTYASTSGTTCNADSFTIIANDGTIDSIPVTIYVTVKDELVAVDPYVVGAQFFGDTTVNGTYDEGEPLSTLTDENGKFTFSEVLPDGTAVIMMDSVRGTHLGLPFDGLLKGNVDSPVTSPLTTMVGNGFTPTQIVDILITAGIDSGMTTDHLAVDPMSLFSGNTVNTSDYPVMHAVIATNTFLKMTNYGLTPDVALDANGDLVAPYASALEFAVDLAEIAINPTYIDNGADPKIVVYIGVAISNYFVDKIASFGGLSTSEAVSFYSDYLGNAWNDFENSQFKAHIDMLVAAYTADPTKYYALTSDGTSAVDTAVLNATSFTLNGYDFVEKKDDSRYTVTGNNVVYDSDNNLVTMTAYTNTDYTSDSISGVATEFTTSKSMISADVQLVNGTSSKQRLDLNGMMQDYSHSGSGWFTQLSVRGESIKYYVSKYDLQEDGTTTAEDTTSVMEGYILSTGSYQGVNLKILSYVDPSTGIVTFEVYNESQTKIGSDTVTIPNYANYNLGYDKAEIRARVKQVDDETTFNSLSPTTIAAMTNFETQDLTYTTATISSGDTVLSSDKNLTYLDIISIDSTSQVTVNSFELSNSLFVQDGNEIVPITLVDDSSQFDIEAGGYATCVLSETKKFNNYGGNVYTELYRSKNTCTDTQSSTEEDTWDWDWATDYSVTATIDNLVTVFTNGAYFEVAGQYLILTGSTSGDVVIAIQDGYWDAAGTNPKIVATSTVVGSWTSDSDSIDADLSTAYKALVSFSLDSNGSIVQSVSKEAGYEEVEYVWTGSSVMDFFTDITGWNFNSVVSNKIVSGTTTYGGITENVYSIFFPNGRYVERGYENGTFSWTCFGKWKEFDTNTFAFTCGNSDTEPTNADAKIIADEEVRVVANGSDSFTIYHTNNFDNPTLATAIESTTFTDTDGLDEITTQKTDISFGVNSTPRVIGDYTVIAYSPYSIPDDSGTAANTMVFTVNGTAGTITVHSSYVGQTIMLKVFNTSTGNLVTATEYKTIVSGYNDFGEIISQ